jgi:hypothetical protein
MLRLGAHDLDLEVTAAGGFAGIVRGSARRRRAGIIGTIPVCQNRQAAGRERERSNRVLALLDDYEPVAAELERLRVPLRTAGRGAGKAMCPAARGSSLLVQIATRDVQHRLDVQVAFSLPQLQEINVLRVAEQPGGFMVERLRALLQLADAKGHPKTLALGPEAVAWWSGSSRRGTGRVRRGGRRHEP